MLVKREQIKTNKGSYYDEEDGQEYFQTVKVHFSMVMKMMIVIMVMSMIMRIINSGSYLGVLPIIATKQFCQFSYKNQLTILLSTSTVVLHCYLFRSSRPEVFCKKGILRNFTKFTGKHPCESFFFNGMFEKLYFCETEQILSKS